MLSFQRSTSISHLVWGALFFYVKLSWNNLKHFFSNCNEFFAILSEIQYNESDVKCPKTSLPPKSVHDTK